MSPRQVVLLTSLEWAVPRNILVSVLNDFITFLESAFTSHSQLAENTATLSLLECALRRFSPVNPLVRMRTCEKHRGWVLRFRFAVYRSHFLSPCPLIHHSLSPITFLFTLLRTLLHSSKTHPFYFQSIQHSLRKTPRRGGRRHPSC